MNDLERGGVVWYPSWLKFANRVYISRAVIQFMPNIERLLGDARAPWWKYANVESRGLIYRFAARKGKKL